MLPCKTLCYCNLDTRQEIYNLEELPVFVKQSIERISLKLKVGKCEATKLPNPGSGEYPEKNTVAQG